MLKNEVLLNKTKELMQEYQTLTGCDASAISVQDFATLRNQALEEIKHGYVDQIASITNTAATKPTVESTPMVAKEEPKTTQKQAPKEPKSNISYINHDGYSLADEEPIVTKKSKAAFLSRMKG